MAFLGTDLNSAYSGMSDMGDMGGKGGFHVPSQFEEKPNQQQQQPARQYSNQLDPRTPSQQKSMQPQQAQQQQPMLNAQVRYDQDMAVLQAELQRYEQSQGGQSATGPSQPLNMRAYVAPEPSFLDTMWSRRRDIMKLVMWSMVIVLAISFHGAIEYSMKKYILENDVSENGETFIRYGYPLAIIALLWVSKAVSPSSRDK